MWRAVLLASVLVGCSESKPAAICVGASSFAASCMVAEPAEREQCYTVTAVCADNGRATANACIKQGETRFMGIWSRLCDKPAKLSAR